MNSGVGTGSSHGRRGIFTKGFAEHNSVTLSTLHRVEQCSTREHYAALAEDLQERKIKVKENTDTNLG